MRSSIEYSIAFFRYRFILMRRMIACGEDSSYDCPQPVKITLWLMPGACIRIILAALDK